MPPAQPLPLAGGRSPAQYFWGFPLKSGNTVKALTAWAKHPRYACCVAAPHAIGCFPRWYYLLYARADILPLHGDVIDTPGYIFLAAFQICPGISAISVLHIVRHNCLEKDRCVSAGPILQRPVDIIQIVLLAAYGLRRPMSTPMALPNANRDTLWMPAAKVWDLGRPASCVALHNLAFHGAPPATLEVGDGLPTTALLYVVYVASPERGEVTISCSSSSAAHTDLSRQHSIGLAVLLKVCFMRCRAFYDTRKTQKNCFV